VLNWLDLAQELLKIRIEKSSDIRTGNIDKFKFMIKEG